MNTNYYNTFRIITGNFKSPSYREINGRVASGLRSPRRGAPALLALFVLVGRRPRPEMRPRYGIRQTRRAIANRLVPRQTSIAILSLQFLALGDAWRRFR